MIELTDSKGNPLPSTVLVDPNGDGLYVQAMFEGNPLSCLWTLTFAGGRVITPSTTFGRKNSQPYFGTLDGFTSTAPLVSSVNVGPQTSVMYRVPPPQLVTNTVYATLTAISAVGSRQIQIQVDGTNPSQWA